LNAVYKYDVNAFSIWPNTVTEGNKHVEDTSQLIWGLIFGSIGFGFFLYGKKQRAPIPLITGIALMAFPYFISNVYIMVLVGAALMALPYFVSI